jgi:hypothetical protein
VSRLTPFVGESAKVPIAVWRVTSRPLWIAVLFATVLATGCRAEDRWSGFVYPFRSDLTKHGTTGEFPTLESCRAEALATMERNGWTESGEYGCGLNCRPWNDSDMMICEKTER